MVNFVFPLMIAVILGFLAGMGVGGGSLLLLWLTQVILMEQTQARILNLLFYLPAAIISSFFRIKRNAIDKTVVIPGIISGCLSAAAISIISQFIDVELAKKLLGVLLIAVGIREVFYRPRNAK